MHEISQANRVEQWRDKLISPSNRYIVVKVGDRLITFPDVLVSEIMIVERNAILALPFYETAIVGVIHHQANVMPLLLLRILMGEQRALITESLTVVRLSKVVDDLNVKNLGGVGLIVDRVIGSLTIDEYKNLDLKSNDEELDQLPLSADLTVDQKKINQTVANIKENEYTPIEIILLSLPTHIWQPQRWQPSI
jgi:chemotaxis signal transduction protein